MKISFKRPTDEELANMDDGTVQTFMFTQMPTPVYKYMMRCFRNSNFFIQRAMVELVKKEMKRVSKIGKAEHLASLSKEEKSANSRKALAARWSGHVKQTQSKCIRMLVSKEAKHRYTQVLPAKRTEYFDTIINQTLSECECDAVRFSMISRISDSVTLNGKDMVSVPRQTANRLKWFCEKRKLSYGKFLSGIIIDRDNRYAKAQRGVK